VPDIDVDELFSDPDLCDCFSVIRRVEVMANNGRTNVYSQRIDGVIGSVQPAGDDALSRLPASDMQSKAVEVYTQFRLRSASRVGKREFKPDLIEWPANSRDFFVVDNLQDWTAFGAGFTKAVCTSIIYVEPPPAEAPIEAVPL
jgi:hypothetical protein